ncbi:MAG: DUF6777 domain-containing protein [Armatimonadota bacterium]|nr:hypothetical protein [bacterium]
MVFVVVLVALGLAAISSASFAAKRADPGSYLVYKADSVDAFVDQLQANKIVAGRYARHYGMSPEKLIEYFRDNLQIKTLDKPYRTTVYFISRGNVAKHKQRVLRAGSRVFVGPDGLPLLEWRCGNPLGNKLPKPVIETSSSNNAEWAVAPAPVTEVAAAAAEALPAAMPIAATPVLAVENAVPAIGGGFAISPAFMALGALPMLFGGVVVKTDNNNIPEVPEPASLVTLIMGTTGAIFYSSMIRRRK